MTDHTQTGAEASKSELKRLVMLLATCLWWCVKWCIPTVVVIIAIGFAVGWGGLFHEEFTWERGIPSWIAIWVAIDFYGWARREW